MFDRCRRWRMVLTRRADTGLSPKEQNALDAHLAVCSECRQCAEADDTLHHVLGIHTGILDEQTARSLDDNIIAAVMLFPPTAAQTPAFNWSRRWRSALPFPFLGQLIGGGVVAASLTVFSLFSTLHPMRSAATRAQMPVTAPQNDPPLSLEALLDSPSPRAALLWRTSNTKARPELLRKPEPNKLPALRVNPMGKPKGASLNLTSHVS